MLEVTDTAKEKLLGAIVAETKDPEVAVRIVVVESEHMPFEFIFDKANENDIIVTSDDDRKLFLVDKGIAPRFKGMTLDFRETPNGPDFIIIMPEEKKDE
ncbi:hypothetical protein ACFL7D_09040 [candidate division KSB1 bacterium]